MKTVEVKIREVNTTTNEILEASVQKPYDELEVYDKADVLEDMFRKADSKFDDTRR